MSDSVTLEQVLNLAKQLSPLDKVCSIEQITPGLKRELVASQSTPGQSLWEMWRGLDITDDDISSSFELITFEQQQRFQQEKIEAREELLALPPENAQKKVNSILFPDFWHLSSETLTWEESLPSYDGEIDP
jgi:hypothetical protein